MRAVVIREPGGPEVLEIREVDELAPPPGHIRVKVAYAGVNRADVLQRMGFYPAPPGVPPNIPGLEYAGTVDALGEGVTEHALGDRVFGLVAGGAYAEQIVVHAREAARVPASIELAHAAAIPEAFVTAFDALVVRGRLVGGERVLITAVGSGVGTAGLQIARALGCWVAGTSRTEDKLRRASDLGLHAGVLAKGGDLAKALSDACPAGFDVVLELVGGSYVEADIAACAPIGRIVVVGLTGGVSTDLNLGALLRKRLSIIGTVLRSRPLEEKIEAARILVRSIGPWLDQGLVKPVIDQIFPLAEVGKAHSLMQNNDNFGKILLAVC